MAEKIMIVSGKGGVGKSTICTGIAAGLSVRGGRVLILETDNGFRGLDISLSVEDTAVYDLADVLESRCEIGDALLRHNRYGMELLCAPLDPSYLPREEQLKTLVLWADRNYDWLLTDCGAGFGRMETMLAGVCDQALIVTTPEPVAVFLGVCTCRFCVPPLPRPKNPPKGSKKKSLNGSLCTSMVFTLLFCTYLICTTDGRAFSAA